MEVYFSTVVRSAAAGCDGEVVRLDWRSKEILARVPITAQDPIVDDPNPRGGARGGRGILLRGQTLHVCTYHSVHLFDRELRPTGRFTGNLTTGLHEICANGDVIWLAATAMDAAVGIDKESGEFRRAFCPRENATLQRELGLAPAQVDKSIDNRLLHLDATERPGHTHLNTVAVHEGKLYVLLNRFGVVYCVDDDRIVVRSPDLQGAHNLAFVDGRIVVNATRGRRVLVFEPDGSLVREIDLLGFPEIDQIHRRSRRGGLVRRLMPFLPLTGVPRSIFVRGLSPAGDGSVLTGFSPAGIAQIDLRTGELISLWQYSDDVACCVHGLLAVPGGAADDA